MPSEFILSRLAVAYSPVPGPSNAGFDGIDRIRTWLAQHGVQGGTGGVIGIAHAANGHIYFGFSAALQAECKDLRLTARIRDAHPTIQTYCNSITQTLPGFQQMWNPGCAEKKIFSFVKSAGTTITNLTVGPYPEDRVNSGLSSHVALGSGSEVYIAPCSSCRSAYTTWSM
ncbi:MAG TPA: hypothetical protein VF266_01650 [Thermoanaerobaculia bacterium]